jgi:hypothetical protein
MTTASVRAHPAPASASHLAPPRSFLRLLRIELRRSPMPWILPLIAALFWFDSYRPSAGQPPLYPLRTFWNMGQGGTIVDFGPFVAGMAAWIGARDGRRGTADLVVAAARPRLTAQLAAWAAAAAWAVGAYLAFVGVMFAVYAEQGVQGEPPWWWVAVGATAVAAFSAAGFAAGAFFPSRFTAPLAAFGGFLAMLMSSQTGFQHTTGWALILPTNSNGNFQPVSGIFDHYLPDLPIARITFLAGIAVAALGLLGLHAQAGGPRLRRAGAAVMLGGVAVAVTAVGLAGTARLSYRGMVIPALHDAANDQPIPYRPVCGHAAGVPVCLHPAYRGYLPTVTDALRPVLGEVAGLPGAPSRVAQVPGAYSSGEGEATQPMTINGSPAVLRTPLDTLNLPGSFGGTGTQFSNQIRLLFAHAFVGAGARSDGTLAQQAVQAALLSGGGVPFAAQPFVLSTLPFAGPGPGPGGSATGPVYAAARGLAAMPAAARHAWLASHLGELRSGRLTLAQLP